jgi:hypothetical protein
MRGTETELQRLREPAASSLATERGMIIAARMSRGPSGRRTSQRELQTKAIEGLRRVERVLQERIAGIDQKFDGYRTQMAQLISVAITRDDSISLKPPRRRDRTAWLRRLWEQLANGPETAAMHAFLGAALSGVDRLYLLEEAVERLADADVEPATPQRRTARKS